MAAMEEESERRRRRKWTAVVVIAIWIQALTGTNLDFSSYSSELKGIMGISQVQLNYLSVASDLGKALGWCSGVSLLYLPLEALMLSAAAFGFFGYGIQWLVVKRIVFLPYASVFVLCFLGGCSVCWFNTVCFVLCIRNFSTNRALALSLTLSFNGLSGALYTLIANAINPDDDTLYLLLNSLVPLFISIVAFIPIARRSLAPTTLGSNATRYDTLVFLCLYILAVITGLYLLCLNFLSSSPGQARVLLVGAGFLMILPLCLPGIGYAKDYVPSLDLSDSGELELRKELVEKGGDFDDGTTGVSYARLDREGCFEEALEKGAVPVVLGEEHPAPVLLRSWDFWLYFLTYFCGGTIGLVYSNNLGQISQSLGYASKTSSLVTLYSSWSFFGRLLAAAPDFIREKFYFPRTGWLALAIVPTPIAMFLLALSGSEAALSLGTALISMSSGFVFSAAVSVTSELFGPNSAGVNHNILIANIPIGSLLYGLLAASVYDSNQGKSTEESLLAEATLCMGRKCYWQTFMLWGCISVLGLVSSFVLFLRTRSVYDRFERQRTQTDF